MEQIRSVSLNDGELVVLANFDNKVLSKLNFTVGNYSATISPQDVKDLVEWLQKDVLGLINVPASVTPIAPAQSYSTLVGAVPMDQRIVTKPFEKSGLEILKEDKALGLEVYDRSAELTKAVGQ